MSLAHRLHKIGTPKVLVIGDTLVDRDLHGSIDRCDPATPGCPVFTEERREERMGGAGAVANMAAALGAEATLLTVDTFSTRERHFVDGRCIFRTDLNRDHGPIPAHAQQAHDDAARADVVLIADYGLGMCSEIVVQAAIAGARKAGAMVIVDPGRESHLDAFVGADCLKVNAAKTRWLIERPCCLALASQFPRRIGTDGANGLFMYEGSGLAFNPTNETHFQARPRELLDPTGAGDMVLAALGVCIGGGMSWAEACTVAVAASGLEVERHGAVPIDRSLVCLDLFRGLVLFQLEARRPADSPFADGRGKVIFADDLPIVVEAARVQGQRIVFTNGCFDVLHAGHIGILAEARAQGDLLIVGVNSNQSVRRLKGPGRPIHSLDNRLATLAGVADVDWLVPFSEETPAALVEAIEPDVLVKGADWRGKDIAGAAFAGRVHFARLIEGLSSTAAIAPVQTSAPAPDLHRLADDGCPNHEE